MSETLKPMSWDFKPEPGGEREGDEPVAWRWRYLCGGLWGYFTDEALVSRYSTRPDVFEVQPLYARSVSLDGGGDE